MALIEVKVPDIGDFKDVAIIELLVKAGDLRPVRLADFQLALKERKPSTTEWLRRSRNYVNFANQDRYYDDLSQFLEKAKIQ